MASSGDAVLALKARLSRVNYALVLTSLGGQGRCHQTVLAVDSPYLVPKLEDPNNAYQAYKSALVLSAVHARPAHSYGFATAEVYF